MASRHRLTAAAAVAAVLGAAIAGATIVWAMRHGFWGTTAVATLTIAWIAAVLWWRVMRLVDIAPTAIRSADAAGDDERIVLRVLLDQAPGALLAVEEGGRVRALNRAARELFDTDDHVLPPPPALLSPGASRLHHGGRRWRIDRAVVSGAGTSHAIAALVDVEPQEHAAEARATRDLLRVLGHEVMNAMAPIASLAESALDVLELPDRRDALLPEILGTLARRADGLRRFTEAYRQVGRLPAPTRAPVLLADLFADVGRLFEGSWRGRATLAIAPPGEAMAMLDRDQVAQALLGLLHNGAEAARAVAGPVTVRLWAEASAGRLALHVADEGPGIDPASTASIFLPFFTTKPDGNGIGLAAARQIAQGHGGDAVLLGERPTVFALILPQ